MKEKEIGRGGTLTFDMFTGLSEDELFIQAAEIVSAAGFGSNKLLRDRLPIGWFHAQLLLADLHRAGVIADEADDDGKVPLLRPCGFY
jgi:hypothetical protein